MAENKTPLAKKHLGQNFLKNKHILDTIVGPNSLEKYEVMEVGPGPGDLTARIIAKKPKKLSLIEIDTDMVELLQGRFPSENIDLYIGDILRTQIRGCIDGNTATALGGFRVFHDAIIQAGDYIIYGNIPYYITSPIIYHLLYTVEKKPSIMTLTMQKEVAERILMREGKFCVLSLTCHLMAHIEKLCDISPQSFVPIPKVWSTCLKFTLKKERNIHAPRILAMAKIGFAHKRKKLISNLSESQKYSKNLLRDIFEKIGLSEDVRAEDLTLDEWGELEREINT